MRQAGVADQAERLQQVAEEKALLEIEYMSKEGDARLAALNARREPATQGANERVRNEEDDDSLVDTSKPKLSGSPSTLNALAWFTLMSRYPSPLGLYLYNILIYGALVGYEGPQTLIISKNLSSALLDPTTINTRLRDDLVLGRVEKVTGDRPFICSPLGLVPKPGGWRRIHHVSYPCHHSVNHHIPEKCTELKYIKFEEVLDMIREGGRSSVILKRDVKDAFRNIPLAPNIRWLFGFP